ncbi:transcription termination/antitermination protein NusA [Candidatus Wolfebacteria bacterium]|nr:transcription termination/antitermination protein NusA [Candidatus Wolfebacteria bacterium]
MDLKILNRAVEQLADEKGISKDAIISAIESSIAAAYKKEYCKKSEIVKAIFNVKSGDFKFFKIRAVVDATTVIMTEEELKKIKESAGLQNEEKELLPLYNSDRHILIEEARVLKSDAQVGEEMEFPLETHEDFGRIAAQAAKQVILQKIREAERESVLKEYREKEGEIVSGIVQRIERGNIFVDLGRAIGVMFFNETISGEYYKIGERFKFYLMAVQEESKLPGLILSRSHPKFVSKLFEIEVPEIHDKTVEIKAIAREAGSRTKIAVASTIEGIDPIGACVGQRGTRVMAVTNELSKERIDIIEWHENPAKFVSAALSPAKVKAVEILPKREAKAFVSEDQVSLAIGKAGQNVRLAARLTGWKIDVRSLSNPDEVLSEGIAESASGGKADESDAAVEIDKKEA